MQANSPPSFRAGSPPQAQTNGLSLPPDPKRQKLAHGPSPLATSYSPTSHYAPYSPQWSPHTTQPPQANRDPPPPSVAYYPPNPQNSFNQPQSIHQQSPSFEVQPQPPPNTRTNTTNTGTTNQAGAMGPPERPQKPIDPNDMTDMVALSGVDLRAEDEYLAQSYLGNNSFNTNTSFGTSGSSTQPGSNSFSQWNSGNYGSNQAFNAGPPFNQRPLTEEELAEETRRKHKRVARQYAETKAKHLRDPFLAAQAVREKIARHTYEEHVRFNENGLRPVGGELRANDVRGVFMPGQNGQNGLAAAKVVNYRLDQDSPLVEVLSLLSLACNERMRMIMEDAYAVSRARRIGSGGVVPPEWQDMATGSSAPEAATAVSHSITGTAWDRPSDSADPLQSKPEDSQRDLSNGDGRLPTPPTEPSPPPQSTIQFKSTLPATLQSMALADHAYEKARLEKRKARKAKESADPSIDTPASSATAPAPAETAPEPPKITKKQQAAEKKNAITDEAARKQANATAAMALGGGRKQKYSWLSGATKGTGASSGLSAGAGMGRGVGTTPKSSAPSTPGPSTTTAVVKKAEEEMGLRAKSREWGSFKEESEMAVQVRDLVGVLERDGLEKKTLARCLVRMKGEEK